MLQHRLPQYQSHKVVRAAKIIEVNTAALQLTLQVEGWPLMIETPGQEFFNKHDPKVGGYIIEYADGYVSWCPAEAFEAGNTLITEKSYGLFGIGHAIKEMYEGRKVAREGWNGKNMYLQLQIPDAHSKMTLPYVYMFTAQGDLVPWLASQTDLLAKDWCVVA